MKKPFFFFAIAFPVFTLLFLSSSCKKATTLTSCLSLSADTIRAGDSVYIANCSQDDLLCNWNFGDGSTSVGYYLGGFTHAYAYPGTYTITLIATDAGGKNATTTKTLVVLSTGGTWSFKSYLSSATTCAVSQNSLIGTGSNSTLNLTFTSLPTASGTYNVVTGPPSSYHQVAITYTNSAGTYVSGNALGPNQTIQVSVAGGKISATGNAITIENSSNPLDNSDLTFDLEQQ